MLSRIVLNQLVFKQEKTTLAIMLLEEWLGIQILCRMHLEPNKQVDLTCS